MSFLWQSSEEAMFRHVQLVQQVNGPQETQDPRVLNVQITARLAKVLLNAQLVLRTMVFNPIRLVLHAMRDNLQMERHAKLLNRIPPRTQTPKLLFWLQFFLLVLSVKILQHSSDCRGCLCIQKKPEGQC